MTKGPIFCGNYYDPREGFRRVKIETFWLNKSFIFLKLKGWNFLGASFWYCCFRPLISKGTEKTFSNIFKYILKMNLLGLYTSSNILSEIWTFMWILLILNPWSRDPKWELFDLRLMLETFILVIPAGYNILRDIEVELN